MLSPTGLAAGVVIAGLLAVGCGSSSEPAPKGPGPAAATYTAPGSDPAGPAGVPNCPDTEHALGPVRVRDVDARVRTRPRTYAAAREVELECLKWKAWGGLRARGRGVARVLDCTPTCADGVLRGYPATIELSGRMRCSHGRNFYTKATLRLVHAPDTVARPVAYTGPGCKTPRPGPKRR